MRLGNRHPAEMINKHCPKTLILWFFFFHYFFFIIFGRGQQDIAFLIFKYSARVPQCTQALHNTAVISVLWITSQLQTSLFQHPCWCSADPARLITSYRNTKKSQSGVKVSRNGLKLKGFQFSLSNWKGALGTIHLLVSWKFSVWFFSIKWV